MMSFFLLNHYFKDHEKISKTWRNGGSTGSKFRVYNHCPSQSGFIIFQIYISEEQNF